MKDAITMRSEEACAKGTEQRRFENAVDTKGAIILLKGAEFANFTVQISRRRKLRPWHSYSLSIPCHDVREACFGDLARASMTVRLKASE